MFNSRIGSKSKKNAEEPVKGSKLGPYVLGLFIFCIVGGSLFQMIGQLTGTGGVLNS